jgi:DNA-binding CsgD family transcriptional regulator/tetratricopeptide (TPR) repeat protein
MQLLERAAFLRTLHEYAAEARGGDGRLVLVSGESGIGKTALLDAFQHEQPEARWLWGACDGLFTPRPLGPLFDIGAQLGREDGELAALCRQGAARDGLFAALLAELDTPAAFPIVVIEDVHWADEATIDLLTFVGRRLVRRAALMLVSYRDDELGEDHPLRRALGNLAGQRTTRRMRLAPLSQDAVRILAAGRDVDIAELHRITGGNPFYVSEILDAAWPSIPPTVRDAVGARLARLSPDARAATELAAVIGARLVGPIVSRAAANSAAAVSECLASGLLVPDGSGLRFRHELARMAVEAGIPPHRKAELHARLLTVLESDGGADAALLAHHAEASGDRRAVLRHAPDAARRASELGAHRESAAQYERALRFAGDLEPADLATLHEGIATEYSLLDRWDDAELARRTALRLRRDLGDDRKVGQNLQLLAMTLWRLCRGEESYRAADEAVRIMQSGPVGSELGFAYASLGGRRWLRGSSGDAAGLMQQAIDIGAQLDLPELVGYALNGMGLCKVKAGDAGGVTELERSLRTGLDAELPDTVGRVYGSLEEAHITLQQFAEAERYFTAGVAFCDQRELRVYSWCLMGWRTVALLLLGRWPEAADMCADLLSRRGISPVNLLNPLYVLGAIKGRRDERGAWDLLDEAAKLGEGTTEPQWIVPVRAVRAELRWLSGQRDLALQEAQAGYQSGLGRTDPWTLGSVAIWLARLEGADGVTANLPEPYTLEAAGRGEEAAQAFDEIGRPYDAALVRLQSAQEDALRQAISTFDELGATAALAQAKRRMRQLGIGNVPRGPRQDTRSAPGNLTGREQEVLALMSEGLRNREISQRLVISERTVHHHVSAILAKVGVTSRSAAVREAARLGYWTPR